MNEEAEVMKNPYQRVFLALSCHNPNSVDQDISHVQRGLEQIPRHRTQMKVKASQQDHDEFPITIPISIHRIMFHGDEIITQPHLDD